MCVEVPGEAEFVAASRMETPCTYSGYRQHRAQVSPALQRLPTEELVNPEDVTVPSRPGIESLALSGSQETVMLRAPTQPGL